MKFPRNARIFRGQLDAAPFAIVLFLLVIFMMLGSKVYTPGVRLRLPTSDPLPGLDQPMIAVAIDPAGRLFFENQLIDPLRLRERLRSAAESSSRPLTLLVQADREVSYQRLINLAMLARDAGIPEAWLATLPRAFKSGAPGVSQ
jgi:biopolymer transport protein ExbD